MLDNVKAHWDYVILFVIASMISFPLLHPDLPKGHDTLDYIPRLVEFHENISNFILFPRWAPDLADGYGNRFLSLLLLSFIISRRFFIFADSESSGL